MEQTNILSAYSVEMNDEEIINNLKSDDHDKLSNYFLRPLGTDLPCTTCTGICPDDKSINLTYKKATMKTLNLINRYGDLREAVESSNQSRRLTGYSNQQMARRITDHQKAGVTAYYLTDNKDLVYLHRTDEQQGMTVSRFSWGEMIKSRSAAICGLTPDDKHLMIGEYKHVREQVSRICVLWTVDMF